MKLVINGYFLSKPKTGMGQYLLQIVSHQQWDMDLVILIPGFLREFIQDIPLSIQPHIQYINTWYHRNDLIAQILWEKYQFPQAVQKYQADIVWSPHPTISRINTIPHIMTVHDVIYWRLSDYIPNWKVAVYVKLLRSSILQATKIITVSTFSAHEISDVFGIPLKQISVIYNASEMRPLKKQKKQIQESYIFYAGGLDIRKNVITLIKAFNIIAPQYPLLKLYIAGNYFPSPLIPSLSEIIETYGLQHRVILLGYISDEDMVRYIQSAEILVYPSLYEGFGLPILEAMQLGTPVITSNIGAMKEVGGDAAVLINPQKPSAIAKAIKSILEDDLLRQSLIYKGKDRAQLFSWDNNAKQLEKIFKQYI